MHDLSAFSPRTVSFRFRSVEVVFLLPTLFSFTVGELVLMPLIAVGILHVVATKKGGSDPALLVSGAVFCSGCINPRLSRKIVLRARIGATYGRSVSVGAEPFPCLLVKIRRPWRRIFSAALMSAWPDYDLLARIKIMCVCSSNVGVAKSPSLFGQLVRLLPYEHWGRIAISCCADGPAPPPVVGCVLRPGSVAAARCRRGLRHWRHGLRRCRHGPARSDGPAVRRPG